MDGRPNYKITWEDIENTLDVIAGQLDKNVKYIYGIPRGGTVPAVMLSHYLGLQFLPIYSDIADELLVVDDIFDTGQTLSKYRNNITAVLYCNTPRPSGEDYSPDIIGDFSAMDNWLVFPWEDW